jgi:tetratricopeptide (TPR) repeat protein
MLPGATNPSPKLNRRDRRKAAKLKTAPGARSVHKSAGADASYARATTLAKAGKPNEAIELCQKILAEDPAHADVHGMLGLLYWREKRHGEAYPHLKWVAENQPENIKAWLYLGDCLLGLAQLEAAVVAFTQAAALEPDNFMAQYNLARACSLNGDNAAALKVAQHAEKLDSNSPELFHLLSTVHVAMGAFDHARGALQRALACDPNYALAYEDLSRLRPNPQEAQELIATLEQKLEAGVPSSTDETIMLFAIGNMREGLADYDGAFEAYARANEIDCRKFPFERAPIIKRVDDTKGGFTSEAFDALTVAGSDDATPIFIVGMPRSGTTLVEQIIASHPQIHAGGEVARLQYIAQSLMAESDGDVCYPRDVAAMDPNALSNLGSDYLSFLKHGAPEGATRVTDKQLFNFLNIGLIAMLFPKAQIIHCRRDPMDTCLSCFVQHFTEIGGLDFARDLEDLGFFYRQYAQVMDHWRQVLPRPMMEVDYEELVDNQEAVSRRMIAHIGLDWDSTCLEFHKTDRDVRTASVWQVRQPIYASSKARWKRYEKHLKPLERALPN